MPQYKLREFKVSRRPSTRLEFESVPNFRSIAKRKLYQLLQVTDARDGSSRTIRQFVYCEWPEQGMKIKSHSREDAAF